MTHQAIPAQAVEAAAYALYLDANGDPEVQWFDITFHEQDELVRTATKALEAAAPHMLGANRAEVWAEGHEDVFWNGRTSSGDAAGAALIGKERADATNPYRTTK